MVINWTKDSFFSMSTGMKINEFAKIVHDTAKEKGWYDKERSPLEAHMLMVTELSEATECVRQDLPPVYAQTDSGITVTDIQDIARQGLKPEGEAVELMDAMIRIADYFAYKGWDLEQVLQLKMDYNASRAYRHGGKQY
ncbi:MAG TPA: hypothetical protein PKB05_08315 [Oligoflexia bacterium]|nr:hypothetical protein [Oligoflexia bacterium]